MFVPREVVAEIIQKCQAQHVAHRVYEAPGVQALQVATRLAGIWAYYVSSWCVRCGKAQHPQDMFRVHDAVWAEAGCAPDSLVCLMCFKAVLPRPLTLADFPEDVPCNFLLLVGATLVSQQAL